jgi:hypothetical protein
MMNIPTSADVEAFMFRGADEHKHLIKLHGFDNSGQSGALVITPEIGFGAHYNAQLVQKAFYNNAPTKFIIDLIIDDGENPGTISIPANCNSFDITYFVTQDGGDKDSYYINTNNVMYGFELENTPIENFCTNTGTTTIKGSDITKSTIKELKFGNSYKTVTTIGNFFIYSYSALTSIDLSGFSGVTTIGNNFLYFNQSLPIDLSPMINVTSIGTTFMGRCRGIGDTFDLSPLSNVTSVGAGFMSNCWIKTLDISPLSKITTIQGSFLSDCEYLTSANFSSFVNVTSVGAGFMSRCTKMTSLDLSGFSNVQTVGDNFLFSCIVLTSIQIGGVDWSNKSVGTTNLMASVPNTTSCTLRANSQQLADIFKSKMNGKISNWTVVIN